MFIPSQLCRSTEYLIWPDIIAKFIAFSIDFIVLRAKPILKTQKKERRESVDRQN